ncbi:hypothetical protein Tco_1423753, partial [Tanacetum coccineum]
RRSISFSQIVVSGLRRWMVFDTDYDVRAFNVAFDFCGDWFLRLNPRICATGVGGRFSNDVVRLLGDDNELHEASFYRVLGVFMQCFKRLQIFLSLEGEGSAMKPSFFGVKSDLPVAEGWISSFSILEN